MFQSQVSADYTRNFINRFIIKHLILIEILKLVFLLYLMIIS